METTKRFCESNALTEGLNNISSQLKCLIDMRYHEQVSIEQLSNELNINSSYLGKVFKKCYQVSPVEYLTSCRMCKAKELLLSKEQYKIKDVAELCGYANQYYFSRMFKSIEGISPMEYRKANSSNTNI